MTAERSYAARDVPVDTRFYIYKGELDRDMSLEGYTTGTLEDSWPSELVAEIESALELVLAEPLSFPYEAMTLKARDIPITVLLPNEPTVETVADLLAEPLFADLTIFDRIVTDNDDEWTWLKHRFGLLEVQRLRSWGRDLRAIVDDLATVRSLVEAANCAYERPVRQIDRWALRTVANKRRHLIQRRALDEQLRAVRRSLPRGVGMSVSHFGIGVGRFLDLYSGVDVTGLDITPWVVDQCQYSSAVTNVFVVGPKRKTRLRPGSCDLTIAVHMLGDEPPDRRRALLEEMWRVTRIGGRIVVIDDFCTPGTLSAQQLVTEIFELGAASLLMSEVASLWYDDTGRIGDGLMALTPISPPGVV